MSSSALPEEIRDHVHDFAGLDVDQQGVVPVTDPLRAGWRIGQRVHPRIDPVALAVIQRLQSVADVVLPIAVAERIEIDAEAEGRPVTITIIAPVVAPV